MSETYYENVLTKIKAKQWTLTDFDWDAPGADLVKPEQRADLKQFMSDLVWIEHIGGRAMGMLGVSAPTRTLKEIYTYFHAEEQRHANAEIALMHRWGMLGEGEIPQPSSDIKAALNAMNKLDRFNDRRLPFVYSATAIPFFEVGLDGAVLKFLSTQIDDPLFHQVFAKINSDESRHLAVGFAVMDQLGTRKVVKMLVEDVAPLLDPTTIISLVRILGPSLSSVIRIGGFLTRMSDAMHNMGIDPKFLQRAFDRYASAGDKPESHARRLPGYRVLSFPIKKLTYFRDRNHPLHQVGRAINRYNEKVPYTKELDMPAWSRELSYEPVV